MARHRLELVTAARGNVVGAVVFDDRTGGLTFERGAETLLVRDRQQFDGTDAEYAMVLIEQGWSNGQTYLRRPQFDATT